MTTDINERNHTEESIKISELNLNSLINNREEAIWSIDRNYNFIIFNSFLKKEYLRVFNLEITKGMNAVDILLPELKQLWKSNYSKALSGERVFFEFSVQTTNPKQFYEIYLSPILLKKSITGVSAISINITDHKEVEIASKES